MNPKIIKIFGTDAEDVQDGDKFIARESSVEGHKVVTLERYG